MKKLLFLPVFITCLWSGSFSYTKYINVTYSEPIYTNEIVREPYRECYTVDEPVTQCTRTQDPSGAVIGGLVGGVIGNQIGRRHHRTPSTVAGAVIGSMVGASQSTREDCYTTHQRREICETKYIETSQKTHQGYRNVGWFKGRKIEKISNRKLKKIPLTITVTY